MSRTDLSPAAPARRVVNAASLFGVLAVTTLITSQFITVGGVLVYSLVVLLHLSQTVATALFGIFGAVALWGFVVILRLAYDAETDPANN